MKEISGLHLKHKHGITMLQYRKMFPTSVTRNSDYAKKRMYACLQKYGVDNPAKSESCKKKAMNTRRSLYGKYESDKTTNQRRQTNKLRYGSDYPLGSREIHKKGKATILKKYGVNNISCASWIKDKKKQTTKIHYGVEHPLQSAICQDKAKQTWLQKYGVINPYQISRVRQNAFKRVRSKDANRYESFVVSLCPLLKFRKQGSFRVTVGKNHYFDPDITVEPIDETKKIVEFFGYPWHYPDFTGQSMENHEKERIDAYKQAGYDCLVIWAHEIRGVEKVREKVQAFCSLPSAETIR